MNRSEKVGERKWERSVCNVYISTHFTLERTAIKHLIKFNCYSTSSIYADMSASALLSPYEQRDLFIRNFSRWHLATMKAYNEDFLWAWWQCSRDRSVTSSQLFPIDLNMNSHSPTYQVGLWGFAGKGSDSQTYLNPSLMVFLETNEFVPSRLISQITVSILISYLSENERLGRWRSNLPVVRHWADLLESSSSSEDGHSGWTF